MQPVGGRPVDAVAVSAERAEIRQVAIGVIGVGR